jgi:dimethylhistidine N-methyltransferase
MPDHSRSTSPEVLAPEQIGLWQPLAPAIWAPRRGEADGAVISLLQSLFDQPRWIEAHHLYDERGAALFEEICKLPEYYPTRTENAILAERAKEIMAAVPVECVIELGAGSSQKTGHLLREQSRRRGGGVFAPIDVSETSLAAGRDWIRNELAGVAFNGLCARYEEAIASVRRDLPKLFVFLGSSIGNFRPLEFHRFFRRLASAMGPEDYFLLGVDCVKDPETIERAYNDANGTTARFILNALIHVNQILGGNFALDKMRYRVHYSIERQQVEMWAESTRKQEIVFSSPALSFTWEKGERILVEISRKFEPGRLQRQIALFDLEPLARFEDARGWFSLLLFRKNAAKEKR